LACALFLCDLVNPQREKLELKPSALGFQLMEKQEQYAWAGQMLKAAGLYNVLWGAWVVLFPLSFFEWASLPLPNYPMIWQSVGMIVGVYGLGYFIASYDPQRHWPIILVGFLGKVFGPVGAVYYMISGLFPLGFAWINLTNDLIWIIPFGLVLYKIWRNEMLRGEMIPTLLVQEALNETKLKDGQSIAERSEQIPVLLVFLRHFGCSFCKEALQKLEENKEKRIGKRLILIHMSTEDKAMTYFRNYDLGNFEQISDPDHVLYRSFELGRAQFNKVFGLAEWQRGIYAAFKGHFPGLPEGDGFRMPGAFLIDKGKVVSRWKAKRASEPMQLAQLMNCELSS
jgi:peroxiredoxin